MNGMRAVAIAGSGVREFHDATEFVTLAARRGVASNPGFQNARNFLLEILDGGDDFVFLLLGDSGFEAKCKHVNEHEWPPVPWRIILPQCRRVCYTSRRLMATNSQESSV